LRLIVSSRPVLERDLTHLTAHRIEICRASLLWLWFTPLREALDAFVENATRDHGHDYAFALKGNVSIVSRQSEYSLYRTDLSSLPWGQLRPERCCGIYPHPWSAFPLGALVRAKSEVPKAGWRMKMLVGRFRQAARSGFRTLGAVLELTGLLSTSWRPAALTRMP